MGIDRNELRDLDAIVNHIIRTAQVEVGPADTRILTEELSKEGVLSVIDYPDSGTWGEAPAEALGYAWKLLLKLDAHMASARVRPSGAQGNTW